MAFTRNKLSNYINVSNDFGYLEVAIFIKIMKTFEGENSGFEEMYTVKVLAINTGHRRMIVV